MVQDARRTHGPQKRGSMLIVAGTGRNRAILEDTFHAEYRLETAENGREGLEKLLDHGEQFCAALLDAGVPVMDGMQLLRRLKGTGLLEKIPVFLITAEASGSATREAYALGVMDVISKPVVPYIVRRRVNSVIELFQTRERLGSVVQRQQSELLRKAKQIMELSFGMIDALSTAIEFRSGESGAHVRRIHDITAHLLRRTELGADLPEEEIAQIALAAIMHDVGKIAIPDAILNKPGRLTAAEFEVMKTHTSQGSLLLSKIPQMRAHPAYRYAHDIARHHHERWDGRGYPDGLKGDEISIWSQVVSIADVYDALVSERVYKDALGFERAVRMIVDGQCGVFNPKLLKAFLAVEGELRRMYRPAAEEGGRP